MNIYELHDLCKKYVGAKKPYTVTLDEIYRAVHDMVILQDTFRSTESFMADRLKTYDEEYRRMVQAIEEVRKENMELHRKLQTALKIGVFN